MKHADIDVAVDTGNSSIKSVSSLDRHPVAIPSYCYELSPGEAAPRNLRNSVHIKCDSGPLNMPGASLLFGRKAQLRDGALATFHTEKSMRPELVFGGMPELPWESQVSLTLQLPHPLHETALSAMQTHLLGTHTYVRNNVPQKVEIVRLDILPEPLGAARYALRHGVIPQGTVGGFIDIGGRTCQGVMTDEDGDPIGGTYFTMHSGGAYGLGELIAKYTPFELALGTTPDLALVLEGIRNGSMRYGTTGISFEAAYKAKRHIWLTDIMASAKRTWKNHKDNRSFVVFVGGCVPLIESVVTRQAPEMGWQVCPEPIFANVLGMLPDTSPQDDREESPRILRAV